MDNEPTLGRYWQVKTHPRQSHLADYDLLHCRRTLMAAFRPLVRLLAVICLGVVLCCSIIGAQELSGTTDTTLIGGMDGIDPHAQNGRVRVALALSGGGARGMATVGVIRAFEERGFDIQAIAGTSMGAIVGGLYACGYSPDELEDLAAEIDFNRLLTNRPPRRSTFLSRRTDRDRHLLTIRFDGLTPHIPRGLSAGQELMSFLTQLTNRAIYLAGGDFQRLPIPFKAVSTDVVSGDAVVLTEGTLAEAMRASMAFPLAFTGVELQDQLLMDGGILYPVPTTFVRDMVDSTTVVVAVNTASPLVSQHELRTPVDIANQVTTIMTADKLQAELDAADIVIKPLPDAFTSTDFNRRDSMMVLGYRQGLEAADEIERLYRRHTRAQPITVVLGQITGDREIAEILAATLVDDTVIYNDLLETSLTLAQDPRVYSIALIQRPTGPGPPLTAHQSPNSSHPRSVDIHVTAAMPVEGLVLEVDGNTIFPDSLLIDHCRVDSDYLTPDAVRELIDSLLATYYDQGYDLANVRSLDFDRAANRLRLEIDEGIIQRVDIRDNDRTKDWLVRSYLGLERGKPYSTRQATRDLADLYGTELFEGITLGLEPFDSGSLVTVRVKEKKYTQLRLGWHWHEAYESEEFLEILDDNIAGVGLQAMIHAQYGEQRQAYRFGMKI
ncbi:hypothetical protein GF377_02360, partial [candidate division GN15 bacterium]|nr:hypothetical protein [candidate division GN15 bacterium]